MTAMTIILLFSCWYPCSSCPFSCLFLCVRGGWGEDAHIPISSTSTKSPTISNKVHVLSSVLLPCLLHFEVELRSCPHTQHIRGKALCILTNSIGGVVMSHWPGMQGQEWDIEASFRLRIMDYSPNRFLSLSVVPFLTWGTHTYICCNFLA